MYFLKWLDGWVCHRSACILHFVRWQAHFCIRCASNSYIPDPVELHILYHISIFNWKPFQQFHPLVKKDAKIWSSSRNFRLLWRTFSQQCIQYNTRIASPLSWSCSSMLELQAARAWFSRVVSSRECGSSKAAQKPSRTCWPVKPRTRSGNFSMKM